MTYEASFLFLPNTFPEEATPAAHIVALANDPELTSDDPLVADLRAIAGYFKGARFEVGLSSAKLEEALAACVITAVLPVSQKKGADTRGGEGNFAHIVGRNASDPFLGQIARARCVIAVRPGTGEQLLGELGRTGQQQPTTPELA